MSKSIDDIILEGQKQNKSTAEIEADLKAAGYDTNLSRDKSGNAYVVLDDSNREPCTVQDNKIVGGGIGEIYTVLYDGKKWHTNGDGETLVPLVETEEEPWWVPYHTYGGLVKDWHDELPQYIPDQNMMYRPEYANKKVEKGKLLYRYDKNGNASYEPISMADYDRDHGRNQ